ncbi:hypothetical protein [uncultured Shewanella sp.]|nr:hypothetical protein [uncultured Shewanella sp.]
MSYLLMFVVVTLRVHPPQLSVRKLTVYAVLIHQHNDYIEGGYA